MNGENRYNWWEHAYQAGVAIEWCADCLDPGVDHAYVAEPETLFVRPGLPADRLNLAAATGLAERDLHHGQALDGLVDPVVIAAHRLLPLPALREAMFRRRGGITAVAADLAVPPTLVRLRLDSMGAVERADIQAAVTAAETDDPNPGGRRTVRTTISSARAAIRNLVAGLARRTGPHVGERDAGPCPGPCSPEPEYEDHRAQDRHN